MRNQRVLTINATSRANSRTLQLVGNQQLVVERNPNSNVLKIVGKDGQVTLSVHITPAGPVLHFGGAGLMIQADGPLAIDAEQVAIHGRKGVIISSDGDTRICVDGDLTMNARAQNISAALGNVNINANDDVRLDGERIMMNC
jgi:hypothetical protein